MVSWLLFSRGSPGSLRSATAADHQQCPPQGVFTPDLTPRFRTQVGVATDQWPAGLTGPEKELSLYVVKRLGVTGWWMGGGLSVLLPWVVSKLTKGLAAQSICRPALPLVLTTPSNQSTSLTSHPHRPALFHTTPPLPISFRKHIWHCCGLYWLV